MLRIYVLIFASFVVAAAGVVALDRIVAREDGDETMLMTKTLSHDDVSLGGQVFHVVWRVVAGQGDQAEITGYVYNDAETAAVSVELRIAGLDSRGQEVADVIRPVGGSVPGSGRAYFDIQVPRSPSYRVTVTSFDFVVSRGA